MFLFFNVVCCARQIEGKKPRRWLRLPDWEMVVLNGGLDWIFMVFQWIPMEAIIIFTIIHPFYGHFMAMEKMMIIGHPL